MAALRHCEVAGPADTCLEKVAADAGDALVTTHTVEAGGDDGAGVAAGLAGGEVEAELALSACLAAGAGFAVWHVAVAVGAVGTVREEPRHAIGAVGSGAGEAVGGAGQAGGIGNVEVVAGVAVEAGSGSGAVEAVGEAGLAAHDSAHEVAGDAGAAGGGRRAGGAVGQVAGVLAIVDHHVVLLVEVLALQLHEADRPHLDEVRPRRGRVPRQRLSQVVQQRVVALHRQSIVQHSHHALFVEDRPVNRVYPERGCCPGEQILSGQGGVDGDGAEERSIVEVVLPEVGEVEEDGGEAEMLDDRGRYVDGEADGAAGIAGEGKPGGVEGIEARHEEVAD